MVKEIKIRKDHTCGNIPPDNLVSSQSGDETAFPDGIDHETFIRALRHEEIHYILFVEKGDGDGGHKPSGSIAIALARRLRGNHLAKLPM